MKRFIAAIRVLSLLVFAGFCHISAVQGQLNYIVGTGTVGNTTLSYPAPFGNYYFGAKQQYVYRATELLALGMPEGNITAIAFNVIDVGLSAPHQGFTVKLKNSANISLATWETGLTTVFGPSTVTPTVGWQSLTLTNPFLWDGLSNIVVEVCFNNTGYSYNAITEWTTGLTGTPTRYYNENGPDVCATANAGTSSTTRPNIRFTIQTLWATDAGISAINSPTTPGLPGSNNVGVTVKNYGFDTLTAASINWQVDGVIQTPYAWTGSLLQMVTAGPVTIGSFNFSAGYHTIKAWTSLPNGVTDSVPVNDTSSATVLFCSPLSGTYTIGGATADYSSIGDAVNAVSLCGVSGPVTFNILPGTYTEQIDLAAIPTSSSTNTITFQSSTQTASDVVIEFNATTTTNPFVWRLNGTDNIRIKYLTLQCSNTAAARVVMLTNAASDNEISGCHIICPIVTSTSDVVSGIYNQGTFLDMNNLISGNTIDNGAYGIFANGAGSTSFETGTVISNNVINNPYYAGIQCYYQTAAVISGNQISMNNPSTTSYGINCSYHQQQSQVKANRVVTNGVNTHYGLFFQNGTASTGTEALVANNFISITGSGTGTMYGMDNATSTNVNYYHNSVRVATTAAAAPTCHGFYITGTSTGTKLRNNILSNFATGANSYAIYANTTTGWTSNYNDLYCTGTNLGYWVSAKATLALWQTASSQDANSVSTNPLFFTPVNLHTSNPFLNNVGTPLTAVTTDIDGDSRSATAPDIGADEFTPPAADAGVTALNTPLNAAVAGNLSVSVSIFNFGLDTLTSATINWKVDGVVQTPFSWTGSVPSVAGATNVVIGSFAFTAGVHNLKLWTSSPNGLADIINGNDTLSLSLLICESFSGTYTIGGTSADYPDFLSAINALNTCGVTGSVVFNVAPGTYTGRFSILAIPGVTDTSTVTFQAANGDSTSVIVTDLVTSPNYIVKFNGAAYVTLKWLTITPATGSTASRCIDMTGNSHHNTILNCQLIGLTATSTSSSHALYFSDNFADNYNTYSNNLFQNGSIGMYAYGTSAAPELGTIISNNKFLNQYYQGIYPYYQNGVTVTGNLVSSNTSYTTFYGIYAQYCNAGPVITKNKVHVPAGGYGIYTFNGGGTSSLRGLVANNFISGTGTASLYLLYVNNCSFHDYFHNSVNVYGTNTSSRALYLTGSSGASLTFKNNILANFADGYAIYFGSTSGISGSGCDYNDLFTSGTYLGYYNSTNKATLANWQASLSGLDAHSVSIEPDYFSNTDLHLIQTNLNNLGTPLSAVPTDIDGANRNQNTPDMGADEFSTGVFDIFGTLTAAQCFGSADGSISLTMDGGTTPFSFLWSNGATTGTVTGLAMGTYFVTVTDGANEDESASFTVSQPTPVTPSMAVTNATSFGGTNGAINLVVNGGTTPYSYQWFSGATVEDLTGLTAGGYLVTVTDSHNCSGTATGYLTSPLPPTWNQPYLGTCTATIQIPVSASILLNGLTPNPGSILGVYYDSLGTPKCAGYVFYNGAPVTLTVQGNSTAPPFPNGYVTNQVYSWKMQDAQSTLVGAATATYSGSFPQNSQFICTGQSGLLTLSGSTTVVQSIPVPVNWSIWSTNVVPVNLNMATLMQNALGVNTNAAVSTTISIVKNYSGQVYWPGLSLNTIGNLSVWQGYQIKAMVPCTLNITGLLAVPENIDLLLPQYWCIIAYLRSTPASPVLMMSTGVSNLSNPYSNNGTIVPWIDILKNAAGQVYWPTLNLNTIGTMKPGQGYQIKMRAVNWTNATYPSTYTVSFPVLYRYPPNSIALSKDETPETPAPVFFSQSLQTGNNLTLGIRSTAWPFSPETGDEVAVVNCRGEVCGSAVVGEGDLAFAVWGDDEWSVEPEGMLAGESLSLAYWHHLTGEVENLEVSEWETGGGSYHRDGVALARKLRLTSSSVWGFEGLYPNPSNGTGHLRFSLAEEARVQVSVFDQSGREVAVWIDTNFGPGTHAVAVDGSSLAPGPYLVRFRAGSWLWAREVIIAR